MTEFFRGPQWASAAAQREWEPRLAAARRAWAELESMSVQAGLRRSALFSWSLQDLVNASKAVALSTDLEVTVLDGTVLSGEYSASVPTVGAPGVRVALHKPGLRREWLAAWTGRDDDGIGQLLGYPPCCVEFFKKVWVGERRTDTTASMLRDGRLGANGPARGNILLRWLGIRLVPHLPCSFNCPLTALQGTMFATLGRMNGMAAEIDALEQLLSLPMSYSALHGIGIVQVGDAFRFAFSTDWTPEEIAFTREPSTAESLPQFVSENDLKPAPAYVSAPSYAPQIWEDNGFKTRGGMTRCHEMIARGLDLAAGEQDGFESLMDLGCGDGTLLNALRLGGLITNGYGVDIDEGRVTRGRSRYPDLALAHGRIQDLDPPLEVFDAVLLMPGRLLEMTPEEAAGTRSWLQHYARRVFVYSYGDQPLLEMLGPAGLTLKQVLLEDGSTAFAEVSLDGSGR